MDKIKIVIADDETIILNGLCKILKELEDIAVVCGTATDGIQLKKLVEQERPDIMITDICMPQSSGLDVVKQIRAHDPSPEIIIISGYKNFEYAQSAMKYGVTEYLLKPINRKELLKIVRQMCEKVSKTKILSEIPFREVGQRQDNENYYQVLIGRCETVQDSERLEKLISKTLPEQCHYFKYYLDLCVVFSFASEEEADQSAIRYAEYLLQNVSTDYAIGDVYQGFNGISQSYASAVKKRELSFFFHENKVIANADIDLCPKPGDSLSDVLNALCTHIRNEDEAAAIAELDRLEEVIICASGGVRDIAIIHFYSAADKIRTMIFEPSLMEIYSPDNILEFVKKCRKFQQVKEFLKKMIRDTMEQIGSGKESQINFEIKMVTDYIKDHYNENITLESMAKLVHKNAYYFSVFFKKYTNENFKDYVMRVRMEKALEELNKTGKTINAIALEAGFTDPNYFSKVFKKYYGFTASSVRKNEHHTL